MTTARAVWSVFVVRMKKPYILGYPKFTKESGLTAQMRRLIWISWFYNDSRDNYGYDLLGAT